MKYRLSVAIVLASVLVGCTGSKNEGSELPSLTPAEAAKSLDDDTSVVFLDVRSTAEYASESGHLRGAVLIPVDSLQTRITELDPLKSKTFVVYCRSGARSARAQKLLVENGFHVLNMLGGMLRWNKEHLPVVKE